jgi:ribonuclease-3
VSHSGELEQLQAALGVRFSSEALLTLALTHRSCGQRNNERLEFLGDSILNHVIAEYLYRAFPDCSEGELSRMRAALVRGDTLAELARELGLGQWIRLGAGELKSGGWRRDSILADALEAVIGAVLLDSGLETLRQRVLDWYGDRLDVVDPDTAARDAKTRLQEYLQSRGLPLPRYQLSAVEGEDHRQLFHVECMIEEPPLSAEGEGSSRRRAEQAAAAAALEAIGV